MLGMENQVIRKRLQALLNCMQQEQIDFYLVPTADFHNSEYVDDHFKVREYLCGFTGSNGTLVISQEEAGLWTDGRYFIQAEKELEGTGVRLFRMQEEGVPDITEYLMQNTEAGQVVAFDGRVVDTAFGQKLENCLSGKGVKLRSDTDLAENVWTDRPALPSHPIRILSKELCGKTMEQKLAEVREVLKQKGCAYFLLTKLDDLMWLCNIRGKDISCNPVALCYGFITMDQVYLFIQEAEVTDELRQYAMENQMQLKKYEDILPFLSSFPYEGKVFADRNQLGYSFYRTLTEKTQLVEGQNPTELLKAVKNETELSHMRKVYLEDSVAVTRFICWLKNRIGKEPISELSAAEYLDGLRSKIPGFLDLSFPTISAYKENAAMMHYEATKDHFRELDTEGMLLVDSGGQYLGGTTDVTRTMVLGPIKEEIRKHYCAVAAGMLQLTDAVFLQGCSGRNLDILARKPLWDMHIDYKCGTGHGVGYILNVHEGPHGIRWRFAEGTREAVLQPGMVVTNEPGVYIEGSHGIRIENVLVVREDEKNTDGQFLKFETLTYAPLDRQALDKTCLRAEDVERIDRYQQTVYEKISPYLSKEEAEWLWEETRPL